ncbi:polysaccharide deacetylase family protein [Hymenobacter properus]|uniref:Polysaccharide deacetylase family protein n=1 Tax=Hymenobacter properus TaxID=2791026 RepID=A0A931BHY8_9BACT|nr:polysaccharide deacetylase family protein [Hymenobacter properus]MBF9144260.1 polysaccharide deacetylase family protein [Hymenobacter properus]MBR7723078.1 polysaccharide deacetylase family protein [Microvirga sp. SRT04]
MRLGSRLEAALLTRPPQLLHALLPGCEWTGPAATPGGAPAVYLTFDDGPIPEETPWVLEQLAQYNAQAAFFCVGENLARYPDIARAALAAGHRLGNHTHRHRSAWSLSRPEYLAGVAECQHVIRQLVAENTPDKAAADPLFRPPYGRLTWPLLPALQRDYRVIMWSVLTRDYDPALSPEDCLRYTLAAVRPGDVLVFHDSRKASARLRFVLPRVLAHFAERGFQFLAP